MCSMSTQGARPNRYAPDLYRPWRPIVSVCWTCRLEAARDFDSVTNWANFLQVLQVDRSGTNFDPVNPKTPLAPRLQSVSYSQLNAQSETRFTPPATSLNSSTIIAKEVASQGEDSSGELVKKLGLPKLTLPSSTPTLDNLFLGLGLLMKLLPRTVPGLRAVGIDAIGFFRATFSELQRGQAGSWRELWGVICSRHSVW